jgi:hypothetical protein
MGAPIATIVDGAGRIIEMKSPPATHHLDPAFDSSLILHESGCDNHTLTLVLVLHLNKVSPLSVPLPFLGRFTLPFADAGGTWFAIRPWTTTDFSCFTREFLRQCAMWSNTFWWTPPEGFSRLDVTSGGRTVRPNIYCHLFVAIVESAAGAQRTIDVVNLDKAAAARQLGKPERKLNASDFRSHDALYDSLDVKPVPIPFQDQTGTTHRLNRSTFAHEIGHALGLPHIGVTHSSPVCQLAILADGVLPGSLTSSPSYPALLKGASNSMACYGHSGHLSLGANIMGFGAQFDASNAQPWVDRIALHTGTRAQDWKVSVHKRLPPRFL